jgi:hypothetical protein
MEIQNGNTEGILVKEVKTVIHSIKPFLVDLKKI